MGSAASTAGEKKNGKSAPKATEASAPRPAPARPRGGSSSSASSSQRTRTSSILSAASLLSIKRGSLVKRSSFVPAAADVQQEIDMKLGGEADAARPPSRSIVVTGPQSGGKSTLIRQLNILFSVEAAESERLKYKKELHKTALLAVQILLSSIDEGERTPEATAVLSLRRRAPITPDVAANISAACSNERAQAALGELSDLAARQACSYFLSRMSDLASPVFVPNPADLLYLDVRTAGRQETRLTGTPGGPLSVVEMSIENFRQFASSEERDARVAAVIYVDSATDGNEELAGYRWQEVRGLACDAALPASVILSKSDLVALQGSSAVPEREVLLPRFGAPAKAVSLHNGLATRAVFLELMSGPLQLSSSDDAAALEEGCYLGLAFFCAGGEGDDRVLLQQRAIPHTLVQPEPLNLEDQLWLQRLPQPVPNPTRATPAEAARLGKGATSGIALNFWVGLCSLSRLMGHAEPEHFGTLHPFPLLMPPGAAMLVLVRCFDRPDPRFAGAPRSLRWKGIDDASVSMSAAMPGGELLACSRERKRTYSSEMEAQRRSSASQLQPKAWLSAVLRASDVRTRPLDGGTYVNALYLCSSPQGLQVLVNKADPSVLPAVKVSNTLLGGGEWDELKRMVARARAGDCSAVSDSWAAAKAWLGPDVTPESAFSTAQKLFYGVVALRQALGRRCTPMRDELQYGAREDAADSLAALGSLLPLARAVVMDEATATRALVFSNFYAMECGDAFPDGLLWYPLELFEARHLERCFPAALKQYLTAKRSIAERERAVTAEQARWSENSQCSDAPSIASDEPPQDDPPPEEAAAAGAAQQQWTERLDGAWDRLRWVKGAVLWASDSASAGGSERSGKPGADSPQSGGDAERRASRRSSRRKSSTASRRRSTGGVAAACGDGAERLTAAIAELAFLAKALEE